MERKRSVAELLRRYVFLCIALLIMAFGVAFSIKADLGTSPISSVPYVISEFTPLTVGIITILMHCVFITLQILILRKRYQPVQLMQLPVALVFGFMTVSPCGCCGGFTTPPIGSSGCSASLAFCWWP